MSAPHNNISETSPNLALQNFPPKRWWGLTAEQWEIVGLYFFLMAGSLWHVLGVLQTAMQILSAPVVFMIALWVAFRYDQVLRHNKDATLSPSMTKRFHTWSIITGIVCFLLEYIGVKTGWIFGSYKYMDVWIPAINGVPIAISFAWLSTLYGSFAIMQRFTSSKKHSIWLRCLIVAVCMTVFDIFMEPVSVKLHYWTWLNQPGTNFIAADPQNYVAWFCISYGLAWYALRQELFSVPLPRAAWHSYWGQLLYFTIIALGASSR